MLRTYLLALGLTAMSGVAASQEYMPNAVLVSFANQTSRVLSMEDDTVSCAYSEVESYLTQFDIHDITECYHGANGIRNVYLITFNENVDVPSIANELSQLGGVKNASPNYKVEFFIQPNDYYYNHDFWYPGSQDKIRCLDQWHLPWMQADKAWDITKGDSTVLVAIFDTGIDYFHPDLQRNIWVNPAEDIDHDGVVWDTGDLDSIDQDGNGLVDDLVGWDFDWQCNDNNPFPDTMYCGNQHGTMMASAFAGTDNDVGIGDTSMAGLAWNCRIVPVKGQYAGDIGLEAINYAINIGVDVINMSYGMLENYSPGFQEAIHRADSLGIVLVAADGWNPKCDTTCSYYPAAFDEVMAVSSVDPYGKKTLFEGYHGYVDICGLGSDSTGRWETVAVIDVTCDPPYSPVFPGAQLPHTYYAQGASTS